MTVIKHNRKVKIILRKLVWKLSLYKCKFIKQRVLAGPTLMIRQQKEIKNCLTAFGGSMERVPLRMRAKATIYKFLRKREDQLHLEDKFERFRNKVITI